MFSFLGAFNGRIQVRIRDTRASAKIVNARGKQENRLAFPGLGPALHPVLEGEGKGLVEGPATAQTAGEEPLRRAYDFWVKSCATIAVPFACVRNGNVSGGRLSQKKTPPSDQSIGWRCCFSVNRRLGPLRKSGFRRASSQPLACVLCLDTAAHRPFLTAREAASFLPTAVTVTSDGAGFRRERFVPPWG